MNESRAKASLVADPLPCVLPYGQRVSPLLIQMGLGRWRERFAIVQERSGGLEHLSIDEKNKHGFS